jgi:glycosyltransferase involved in cell wall biosynthesis
VNRRSPNILYLTYDGLGDPLGQSQILPYLEGLAEKGYEITVISFEKAEGYKPKAESIMLKAKSQKLRAIQLKYHKSPPVVSTLYDLYLLRHEVKKAVKSQQIDIIHCRSYITSLAGLWAKRKYGVRFIFDMRGFWADERVEGGLWNLKNPVFKTIYQYFKRKERKFLLEADATISLTHNAKNEIEQGTLSNLPIYRSTEPLTSISVIPTCADLQLFNPEKNSQSDSAKLKENLGIDKDDFVLLYLGSLGTWYMLEEMLDFYSVLKAKSLKPKARSRFLFVTREQEMLKDSIKKHGFSEGEIIITACMRQEVPKYISICDASIFFILPTYSKKASAATKMGEIMAMGKPVITNTGWGDVDLVIPQTKAGVLVQEFSPVGYWKAIDQMNSMEIDPLAIRKSAEELFSLQRGVEKYDSIYRQLSGKVEKK